MTLLAPDTTAAIQVGDTIASLQGLVTAYSHVLQQAKEQLEQLELTDDQLQRIEQSAISNTDYSRLLNQLHNRLANPANFHTEQQANALLDVISRRVSERLSQDSLSVLQFEIKSLVQQERLDATQQFKDHSEQWFQREVRNRQDQLEIENHNLKRTLRSVLSLAYSTDELNQMAARALQESPDRPAA